MNLLCDDFWSLLRWYLPMTAFCTHIYIYYITQPFIPETITGQINPLSPSRHRRATLPVYSLGGQRQSVVYGLHGHFDPQEAAAAGKESCGMR